MWRQMEAAPFIFPSGRAWPGPGTGMQVKVPQCHQLPSNCLLLVTFICSNPTWSTGQLSFCCLQLPPSANTHAARVLTPTLVLHAPKKWLTLTSKFMFVYVFILAGGTEQTPWAAVCSTSFISGGLRKIGLCKSSWSIVSLYFWESYACPMVSSRRNMTLFHTTFDGHDSPVWKLIKAWKNMASCFASFLMQDSPRYLAIV